MEVLISNYEIENTIAYQELENCFKILILKRSSKKNISNALLVYRTTGVIPGSMGGNCLRVLKEIIQNDKN
jgi:hypothetical protein